MTFNPSRVWGRILSDRLFRSTAYIFFAVVVGGFANYGLQVVMGRVLSDTEYGFFNALLGVFVVLAVPVNTLMMVVAKKTAEIQATLGASSVAPFFRRVSKEVVFVGLLGLFAFTLFLSPLSHFLKSPSWVPIFILGLCVVAAILSPVPIAVLQGLQKNAWFAFIQGFGGPARFLFCAAAGFFGFGVSGVMGGLLLSQITVLLLAMWGVARLLPMNQSAEASVSPAWSSSAPILAANLAFAVMTQTDLVLVNNFFTAKEASLYASAAVLGRSVIYVPGALVLAMFPMVSQGRAQNLDTRPLLAKGLLATFLLSGIGAGIFYFWSEEFLNFLFGVRYAASAPILKYYGLAMLPLAMLMVLFNYLVARSSSVFSYVMMAGALLEVILMSLYHPTLLSVVFIYGGVGSCLFVFGLAVPFCMRSPNSSQARVAIPVEASIS